jgi:hypothetical protein
VRDYKSSDQMITVNTVVMGIDKITINDDLFQFGQTERSLKYLNFKNIKANQLAPRSLWTLNNTVKPVLSFEMML